MNNEAINLLYDLRASTFRNAAPLPRKEDVVDEWQGVGFVISGVRMVSALGEVSEIMLPPKLARLPAVKSWVKGVANVRGRLVPVIDLHEFLHLPRTLPAQQWRMLLIEQHSSVFGLLVEQSLGMLHFPKDSYSDGNVEDMEELEPFISGAFRQGGRVYHKVHLGRIVGDTKFNDVACATPGSA